MMNKLNEILAELEIKYPNFYERHTRYDFEVFKYGLLARVETTDEDDLMYVVNRLVQYALGFDNKVNYINISDDSVIFNCPNYNDIENFDVLSIINKMHNDIKNANISKFIIDLRNTKLFDLKMLIRYLENSDFQVITIADRSSYVFNKSALDYLKRINSIFIGSEFNHKFFDNEGFNIDIFVNDSINDIMEQNDLCMMEALKFNNKNKNIKK